MRNLFFKIKKTLNQAEPNSFGICLSHFNNKCESYGAIQALFSHWEDRIINRHQLNPLEPAVPLSGLVLEVNASVVKSMGNLDAKCEVQICPCTFCS